MSSLLLVADDGAYRHVLAFLVAKDVCACLRACRRLLVAGMCDSQIILPNFTCRGASMLRRVHAPSVRRLSAFRLVRRLAELRDRVRTEDGLGFAAVGVVTDRSPELEAVRLLAEFASRCNNLEVADFRQFGELRKFHAELPAFLELLAIETLTEIHFSAALRPEHARAVGEALAARSGATDIRVTIPASASLGPLDLQQILAVLSPERLLYIENIREENFLDAEKDLVDLVAVPHFRFSLAADPPIQLTLQVWSAMLSHSDQSIRAAELRSEVNNSQ